MKKNLSLFLFLLSQLATFSQTDSTKKWSFGILPSISSDSDIGFRYGGLATIYNFGGNNLYPDYRHSLYFEWTRTTKGSGTNNIRFDTKAIPNARIILDFNYLTEKALDFYGFNGKEANYNAKFEDQNDTSYISRMFYRHERKTFFLAATMQQKLKFANLQTFFGYYFFGNKVASVDIETLNSDLEGNDKLPDTPSLYDRYIQHGIIPESQKNGNDFHLFCSGLVYDSRDNEPNPTRGMWIEALYINGITKDKNVKNYGQLSVTWRQYFSTPKKRLTLCYRAILQTKLWGELPFYMLPFYMNTYCIRNGFGGGKSLRGILRNRIVGNGVFTTNIELRSKIFQTKVKNQDFYISLNGFYDLGTVFQKYEYPQTQNFYIEPQKDILHTSYGAGLRFAFNENFIVAIDYALANQKQDGESGLYIALDFLF